MSRLPTHRAIEWQDCCTHPLGKSLLNIPEKAHSSFYSPTFFLTSDMTPMRVSTCWRDSPSRGTPSAKVSAPSAPGSHKCLMKRETYALPGKPDLSPGPWPPCSTHDVNLAVTHGGGRSHSQEGNKRCHLNETDTASPKRAHREGVQAPNPACLPGPLYLNSFSLFPRRSRTSQWELKASWGGIPQRMMAFRNALRCRALKPRTCRKQGIAGITEWPQQHVAPQRFTAGQALLDQD